MSDKDEVIKRLVDIRCPKCNEKIEWLNNYASGEMKYEFDTDTNSLGNYEEQEFQPNDKTNDYECPHCSETLFIDEDKALKFLNGRG